MFCRKPTWSSDTRAEMGTWIRSPTTPTVRPVTIFALRSGRVGDPDPSRLYVSPVREAVPWSFAQLGPTPDGCTVGATVVGVASAGAAPAGTPSVGTSGVEGSPAGTSAASEPPAGGAGTARAESAGSTGTGLPGTCASR